MIPSAPRARLWFRPRWYVVVTAILAGAAVGAAIEPRSRWVGGLITALVAALICFWRPISLSIATRRGRRTRLRSAGDSPGYWGYVGGDGAPPSCDSHGDCGGDSGGDGGGGD